jgi:hypothetical protein
MVIETSNEYAEMWCDILNSAAITNIVSIAASICSIVPIGISESSHANNYIAGADMCYLLKIVF